MPARTEQLSEAKQVRVDLYLCGRWDQGNYLAFSRWDGRVGKREYFVSKGDLSRRLEFVSTGHGDLLSAGLFIPFSDGWRAVKQFIEADGERPDAIEWVNIDALPSDTLVDLGDRDRIKMMRAAGRVLEDINPPEAMGLPGRGTTLIK